MDYSSSEDEEEVDIGAEIDEERKSRNDNAMKNMHEKDFSIAGNVLDEHCETSILWSCSDASESDDEDGNVASFDGKDVNIN